MVVHSRREMIRRIYDAGFTEASLLMRQGYLPCNLDAWHTYFLSGGNVFLDNDGRSYFIAKTHLAGRPPF